MADESTPVSSYPETIGPTRGRLAGWCLVIAATGTPATVAVQFFGQGAAATAGATAIGTITVTALATARAFMRTGTTNVENAESLR